MVTTPATPGRDTCLLEHLRERRHLPAPSGESSTCLHLLGSTWSQPAPSVEPGACLHLLGSVVLACTTWTSLECPCALSASLYATKSVSGALLHAAPEQQGNRTRTSARGVPVHPLRAYTRPKASVVLYCTLPLSNRGIGLEHLHAGCLCTLCEPTRDQKRQWCFIARCP